MRVERAVIDTNVLISAALSPRSAPTHIVDGLLEHATLMFSRETFEALETRPGAPNSTAIWTWNAGVCCCTTLRRRRSGWNCLRPREQYSRDPDDDVFVHTALHGSAQWLISGDRDLLELPYGLGVEILSPAQALEQWRLG